MQKKHHLLGSRESMFTFLQKLFLRRPKRKFNKQMIGESIFDSVKANIHSGKFQPVRFGLIRFLLFSEYNYRSREHSENKRKRLIS